MLEGKRSTDKAWHHCEVSTCSNGGDYILKVQFSGEEEEYISTPDEALSRLRPRSRSLQNGECKELQVGDTVLASLCRLNSEEARPSDAKIKAVHRHGHLSSEKCICRLDVLPIDDGSEGLVNIPANQVHLINFGGSICDHKVVCDWIQAKSRHGCHGSNKSDTETDVQAQLDMEIDKITEMTESTNETSVTENSPAAAAAIRRSSRITRGNIRRKSLSLGPTNKQSGKSARKLFPLVKQPHFSPPSVPVGDLLRLPPLLLPVSKQPRLSPLAARAALAATLPTVPLTQMQQPGLPISKETPSGLTKYTQKSRRMATAHSASPKAQTDCKAKEQKRKSLTARRARGHLRVPRNALYSGSNPSMGPVNRDDMSEDVEVSLSIDVFPERSVDLVVELPIFSS